MISAPGSNGVTHQPYKNAPNIFKGCNEVGMAEAKHSRRMEKSMGSSNPFPKEKMS